MKVELALLELKSFRVVVVGVIRNTIILSVFVWKEDDVLSRKVDDRVVWLPVKATDRQRLRVELVVDSIVWQGGRCTEISKVVFLRLGHTRPSKAVARTLGFSLE